MAVERARTTDSRGWWPGGPPLTLLAFEAVLAASDQSIVRAVEVDAHYIRIVRGDAELQPGAFDLRDHISTSGAALYNGTHDPLEDQGSQQGAG